MPFANLTGYAIFNHYQGDWNRDIGKNLIEVYGSDMIDTLVDHMDKHPEDFYLMELVEINFDYPMTPANIVPRYFTIEDEDITRVNFFLPIWSGLS